MVEQQWYGLTQTLKIKGVHTFPKGSKNLLSNNYTKNMNVNIQ